MMKTEQTIDWYFDFISPFAYFQFVELERMRAERPALVVHYKPVLFAGLLKHHGHKGPAEIDSKRAMTYRFSVWYAKQQGIPFAAPAGHPFNPLAMLRLAIARGCDVGVIGQLFRHVWVESAENADFYSAEALADLPGLGDAAKATVDPIVKQKLIDHTEGAIARGVFGVPTIAVGEALFWGVDMTAMAFAFLDNPALFDEGEYARVSDLPVLLTRR